MICNKNKINFIHLTKMMSMSIMKMKIKIILNLLMMSFKLGKTIRLFIKVLSLIQKERTINSEAQHNQVDCLKYVVVTYNRPVKKINIIFISKKKKQKDINSPFSFKIQTGNKINVRFKDNLEHSYKLYNYLT